MDRADRFVGGIGRRRLLKYLGAGALGTALASGPSAAARPTDPVGLEVPLRRPRAGHEGGRGSKVALGPYARTYEPFPVSTDEVTNRASGDADGFVGDSDDDGEVLEIGTEYDGFRWEDTFRTADFDGDGDDETTGPFPSDAQIATGPDEHVAVVNSEWAVFEKDSGAREFEVRLEDWFDDVLPPGTWGVEWLVFDPRVRYDPDAGRFYLLCVEYSYVANRGNWLLSVSDDDDPHGDWTNYRVPPLHDRGLVDYPGLGYDGRAVYLTQNFFSIGGFVETTLAILNREDLLAGGAVEAYHFRNLRDPTGGKAFTVQPANMPGSTGPYYLANTDPRAFTRGVGGSVTVWTVEDPTDDPTVSNASLAVGPYTQPPPAEQPDSDGRIDTIDARLLDSPAWDPETGSLWTGHPVRDGGVASSRWYEIDPAEGDLVQSGTHGAEGASAFMPAFEARDGDVLMVYNVSGPDTYPGMAVAGRREGTASGEMADATVVQPGVTAYDYGAPVMRWGDYNGVAIDPGTGRYWCVSQYSPPPNEEVPVDTFATRIAEASFQS
ncbi:MAG: hypothetical protein ABEJ04_04490 [Halobacteriaceae archaeon]